MKFKIFNNPYLYKAYLKNKIKKFAECFLGIKVYRELPRGIEPFSDIIKCMRNWRPYTLFDVGANIGQSATSYARRFPSADIFSFEPAVRTFSTLVNNTKPFKKVHCLNLALSDQPGHAILEHGINSQTNRIRKLKVDSDNMMQYDHEQVVQTTIDDFCRSNEIRHIDYLKVDTEGNDLAVLRGAKHLLLKKSIDFIEVEAGVGSDNIDHVPLADLQSYLLEMDYSVFGFYEQVHEWKLSLKHLRRVNVLFISKNCDQASIAV